MPARTRLRAPAPGLPPRRGVTLVELLVALAIVGMLMSFLLTSLATTTRSVELGSARKDVVQNARVALALMARELQTAALDSRNRDFVFVCADGLNSLPHARIQYVYTAGDPDPTDAAATAIAGVGNAQHPLGLDITDNGTLYSDYAQVYDLYRLPFGAVVSRIVSAKAEDESLPPGPPDRLDFIGLATNVGGFTTTLSAQFAEIRYLVAVNTFADGGDNDSDGTVDAADSTLPGGTATWTGTGDVLQLNNVRETNLANITLLGVYRAIDASPDNNPFSNRELPRAANVLNNVNDPGGRHPFRDFTELTIGEGGELIGAFIYDLQFEFYGRIATQLDTNGAPVRFGIGWGYQDVRGEDFGIDGDARTVDGDGTQANGILDAGEDLGPDGVVDDPGSNGTDLPDNISDNDAVTAETSLFEGDDRLQSRVMGVWDSRAPDPRNPRSASELNGVDDDGDAVTLQTDGVDNDGDGTADDAAGVLTVPETTGAALLDSIDDAVDVDNWRDDRFYDSAGKPEGVDEPDEANPYDDSLPRAVRITITARDSMHVLDPVVMSTTVWLSAGG